VLKIFFLINRDTYLNTSSAMIKMAFGIILSVAFVCNSTVEQRSIQEVETSETYTVGKIRVLNFGTPHLGRTSDANASMINLEDPQEQAALTKMVAKIAEFKPTVIFIELGADNNDYIQETFEKYKIDQNDRLNYSDEMNSIGLEVGRLSGTARIYGIDTQMGFDYPSLVALASRNASDSMFVVKIMDSYKKVNSLKLREQFAEMNTTAYKMQTFDFYNFLATQHTENNYEGATEVAKFFERNLRMYSNLNNVSLTTDDKVFILTGATHAAYLDIFIGNSKKFTLEEPTIYTSFSE
jgi:hypothetical protein